MKNKSIILLTEVPVWIQNLVEWTVQLLIPEWDVKVSMVDKFEETDKSDLWNADDVDALGNARPAEVYASSENLAVDLKILSTIKENYDGEVTVVHELCHAFFCRMSEAAKNLISSKVVKKTAWKSYDAAEETTVVVLSRSLVKLRRKLMLGELHASL